MKVISTQIKDDDMIAYLEIQRERYGSYSNFIRTLIIDRMEGRNTISYTEYCAPVYDIKKKVKENPRPFMSELKEKLAKRNEEVILSEQSNTKKDICEI